MAIRTFDMVFGMMHEKYENVFKKQTKMAELTLHCEGSIDSYPKVIPFTTDDENIEEWNNWFDREILANYLLGFGLGVIEKNKDKYILNFSPTEMPEISDAGVKFYEIKD